MLTGGASVTYAKGLATNKKNAIFLSGYQDAESPGRRLQELSRGDRLTFADGTSVVIDCQVDRFKLSAHSDQGQLLSVIKQANSKALALVHGEQNALAALREKLGKDFSVNCPVNGKMVEGINSNAETSQDTMQTIRTDEVEVHISDTGVGLDENILSSKEWKEFANGKHKATLRKDCFIVYKNDS